MPYCTPRHRCFRTLLWKHHQVHFISRAGLAVDAAFCPWQRTLWVKPGLGEAELALIVSDVAIYVMTRRIEDLTVFEDVADDEVKRTTSPTAIVVPLRRVHLISLSSARRWSEEGSAESAG